MSRAVLRCVTLPILFGLASAPLAQAADPQTLLTRMQQAAGKLNYDGIFVYQHGDQLESLRIIHKISDGIMRERLISLNGASREISRTGNEVRCYLPDENAVMIEHRRADSRNFPALLPDSLSVLKKNYEISVGGNGRVAGRIALAAQINPRDAYRYGYRLWADKATGLLLKASLIDGDGDVIEQYMFTQISIGKDIPESDLSARHLAKATTAAPRPNDALPQASTKSWGASQLPAGYTLSARMQRKLPARRQPVEHLVYTDGLAVVSVFIEPVNDATAALSGLTHMGAVHAFGKVLDGHQITVLGEAPAKTVDMIGASVVPLPHE